MSSAGPLADGGNGGGVAPPAAGSKSALLSSVGSAAVSAGNASVSAASVGGLAELSKRLSWSVMVLLLRPESNRRQIYHRVAAPTGNSPE